MATLTACDVCSSVRSPPTFSTNFEADKCAENYGFLPTDITVMKDAAGIDPHLWPTKQNIVRDRLSGLMRADFALTIKLRNEP